MLRLLLLAACAASIACAEPVDPIVPYLREGEASLAEGAGDRALTAYRAVLVAAPGDRRALVGVLRSEIVRGDGEAALRALRAIDATGGEAPADDVCAAIALAAEGRIARGDDAALDAAHEHAARGCDAVATRSLEARALVAAGDRARADGRYDPALRAYLAAVDADPARARAFAAAGEVLLAQGRVDDAVSLLAVALERHPEDRALRDLMVRALSMR